MSGFIFFEVFCFALYTLFLAGWMAGWLAAYTAIYSLNLIIPSDSACDGSSTKSALGR